MTLGLPCLPSLLPRKAWGQTDLFPNLFPKIPEGTGTLLDNTTLVWTNELSDGHIHIHIHMPYVIAGKGGGYFDTGRFEQTFYKPHNDV
ncbi:MAG: hypothetical protein MK101_12500, partial [Phycisphaerales bacterium]|nr:hypothetical protein [Phycisphaerales bacterium]